MNYADIVNLIFTITTTLVGLLYIHYIFFAIVGLFAKRTFPKAKEQKKYGIVVSARNEASVIGNLIKSIQKTDYPQDKLHIFIVAHNCSDNTAQVCRDLGATVYEYNNEKEKTKGYALKYLFNKIEEDYKIENFDGFYVFDADNIVSHNYFNKMNDAFIANKGKAVITSYRHSKNFGYNMMSGLYGLYFLNGCRFEMRGRTATNCSTRVSGTGYLMSSEVVKDGWNYVTLTEDWELTADQIISNHKVIYCDEAEFYDEQPTSFKVMWRQRVRWQRGHLLVCKTRMKDLLKSLFGKKKEHKYKFSLYDNIANILPFGLIFFALGVLQFVILLFAPLFGLSFWIVMWNWAKGLLFMFAIIYLTCFLGAIVIFIAERKRLKVKWYKKLGISLLWPLFLIIQMPIDAVALFSKNLAWKTIPHHDTTSIEDVNTTENK